MNYIEDKILNKDWMPNDLLPSEFELSQEFSVSRITAKKALDELENLNLIYRIKGKGSFVCDNSSKIFLKNKNSLELKIIALVLPHSTNLGRASDIIKGLNNVLRESGIYLTLHISNQDIDEERRIIERLLEDNVNGIILNPVSHIKNLDLINHLVLERIPLVTIDKYFEGLPISSVLTDNFEGSYIATSHFISQGHKEIAFVTDIDIGDSTTIRDRYFGYCKALKDHSIDVKNENFVCIDYLNNELIMKTMDNSYSTWSKMLDSVKCLIEKQVYKTARCTAIHAAHDYLAIYIMKAALEMGIKVPDDLSIIGFDNIENCSYVDVPITSIEYDFNTIGMKCGELILEKINSPSNDMKKILIPVGLVRRSSVAMPSIKLLNRI